MTSDGSPETTPVSQEKTRTARDLGASSFPERPDSHQITGSFGEWLQQILRGVLQDDWRVLSSPEKELTDPETLIREARAETEADGLPVEGKTTPDPELEKLPLITMEELARHSTQEDCWIAIHGIVYNVTDWVPRHPGGAIIYKFAGLDCTDQYEAFHARETAQQLKLWRIGRLRRESGDITDPRPVTRAYRRLRAELWEKGYFRFNAGYYILKHLCLLLFLGLAILCLRLQTETPVEDSSSSSGSGVWNMITGTLAGLWIALFWQQSAFIAHDSLHNGVLRYRISFLELLPKSQSRLKTRLRKAIHWWRFKRFLRNPDKESRKDVDIGGWEPFNVLGWFHGAVVFGISSAKWLSEHSGHHAATLRPMEDPQFNYLPMWMQSIKELGCEALQGPKWENVRKRLQELTPSFEIQPEGVRALIQPTTVSTQNGGNDELSDDAAEEEEDDESTKTGEKREKEKMKKKKKEKKEMMMVKIPDSAFKTASGGFPELDLLSRLIIRIQHFTLLPLCVVAGRVNFYFESWAYAIRHLVIADIIGMALYWMWYLWMLTSVQGWQARLLFFLASHVAVGGLHVQLLLSHLATDVFTKAEELQMQFFEFQLRTSRNIRSYWWNHWIHGGLELQIEHHLFPQLPRHNLRAIRPHVQAICKAYSVPYEETGFWEGVRLCLRNFQATALALWDQSLD